MSLVHRLAAVFFTATAAASATVGCAASETVVAVTINPDQSDDAPLIEKVHVTLTRGSSKVTRDLDAPDPAGDPVKKVGSFYERFIVDGWDGKVKISAEGYFEDEVVEEGSVEATAELETAVAAAVTLKTPATIAAEEAKAAAAGAGGCACPCGAGGAGGAGGEGGGGGSGGADNGGSSNNAGDAAGSSGSDTAGKGNTGGSSGKG